MKVYKITTKAEWNPEPTYHAGHCITDIFKDTNEDFHNAITSIEEIQTGLSIYEIIRHELPMTITL